jgi:putative ABC transport system ATP-binding protein
MHEGETEPPVIQLQNVYRTYEMGDQVLNALDGVSLDISRNEYVAIVGASGSGKSTIMNIVGCLDRITKGDYLLNGTNVGDMSEAELARARNGNVSLSRGR